MPRGVYSIKKRKRLFQKGNKSNLGKHWKIKDTSKMHKWPKGHQDFNLIRTEEWKQQKRERMSGSKNPMWIDGRTKENNPRPPAWTRELRQSIRQRDQFVCEVCEYYPALFVHHIDYDKLNCEPENLITLCLKCHMKTNHNREYWIKYFKRSTNSNRDEGVISS